MVSKFLTCSVFLFLLQISFIESIRRQLTGSDICRGEFRCSNNECIPKRHYCDRTYDCEDNSDELYCIVDDYEECPHSTHFRCTSNGHYQQNNRNLVCIPVPWKCDGENDCPSGNDEFGCDRDIQIEIQKDKRISFIELEAYSTQSKNWITRGRKSQRKLQKWGSDLPRKAVALYFTSKPKRNLGFDYLDEIAYELTTNFLFKIALKKIDDVSTADIASYVNAFLVTCINPRQFYVLDLVKELRTRLDNKNGTNPFALLSMCNAQGVITLTDVQKLEEAFEIAKEKHRIDTMAMIVLALSCAFNQQEKVVDKENISNLVLELKKLQYRNGTVENVKTTALVMQALLASEEESDEDEFDAQKAIKQILLSKNEDGSFGNLANTYYVLPVLNGLSLINITTSHCSTFVRDEREGLQHLKDQLGDKISVKYSLWVGDDKFFQRTLTMRVPVNSSFYSIMEYASDLDGNYKFEYNVRNRKPFVYSLNRFMDDPEKEMFWTFNQLFNETSGEVNRLEKSPADVYPKDNDHLLYWYKSEA